MRAPLVLCYHSVSPGWEAALSVTPEALDEQLSYLKRRGYRGATLAGALSAQTGERQAVISFDDGYKAVLEVAFPILEKYGFTGTLFVVTDLVGKREPLSWPGIEHWLQSPHRPELEPLSWEELRRLADAGWEIGSHTRTHPHLPELDGDTLADELQSSKARCEEMLGRPCTSLAYPYGDHDERVIAAAAAAGYEFAVTLPRSFDRSEPLAWPRVGIYHADGPRTFKLKVSPTLRWLRKTRAWRRLDSLRRRLKR